MAEYTVTYPVHLGQEVWVDVKALPRGLLQTRKQYLKADIRALILQMKGNTERKSIKLRIGEHWKENGGNFCYKHFKFSVSAIGKTVFLEKPEETK